MIPRILLSQIYWPGDSPEQTQGKWQRAIQAMGSVVFGSDKAWELTIRRHVKKRSCAANNYLWGVVYALMSDASGYEKEELHELMCGKFFGTKVIEVMGVKKRLPVRTTTTDDSGEADTLGTGEFAEFVDFAIREAAIWFDLAIPPPTLEEVPR